MKSRYTVSRFMPENAPLAVIRLNRHTTTGMHCHDFHELVLVTDGECIHHTENESYPISAGDLFLIKPGVYHSYQTEHDFALINLLYRPRLLKLPLFDLASEPGYQAFFELEPELRPLRGFRRHFKIGKLLQDELVAIIDRMEDELRSGSPGHLFRAVCCLMRLIGSISHNVEHFRRESIHDELFRLGEVISFMREQCNRSITLSELAERAAMSQSTLNRRFRQALGRSPMQYLTELRIAEAKRLLSFPGRPSVGEVAERTGFEDSNYFIRIFKRHTGMTPNRYRASLPQSGGAVPR